MSRVGWLDCLYAAGAAASIASVCLVLALSRDVRRSLSSDEDGS